MVGIIRFHPVSCIMGSSGIQKFCIRRGPGYLSGFSQYLPQDRLLAEGGHAGQGILYRFRCFFLFRGSRFFLCCRAPSAFAFRVGLTQLFRIVPFRLLPL